MISGCVEEVGAFGGEEAVDDVADALDKRVDGARWLLAQKRFELREGLLDRVQVGAVGRQVEDLGAAGGDDLADPATLWAGKLSSTTTSPRRRVGASTWRT